MTIYERIRMLRKMNKMSQEELAHKCGYEGRSMISRIEAGQIDLQLSKLYLIAAALGVNIEYLFGTDENQRTRDMALELTDLINRAAELDATDRNRVAERIDTLLEQEKYQ